MPQSLSKVYVHIIFSTKNRLNTIDKIIESSLYEYIGGICKGMECNPLIVGGHKNHIHVLCLLSRKVTQMKLLEEVKKQSSKWIKTKGQQYQKFYWQDGYGIFSVKPSETNSVVDYIRKQEEHHEQKSFKDELRGLLSKHKVDYDERYLWD